MYDLVALTSPRPYPSELIFFFPKYSRSLSRQDPALLRVAAVVEENERLHRHIRELQLTRVAEEVRGPPSQIFAALFRLFNLALCACGLTPGRAGPAATDRAAVRGEWPLASPACRARRGRRPRRGRGRRASEVSLLNSILFSNLLSLFSTVPLEQHNPSSRLT
jgi:hypothetical protein